MASPQCPIDQEPLSVDDEVVAMPCGHVFHRHCVSQWLEINSSCPTCRRQVNQRHILRLFLDIDVDQLQRLQSDLSRAKFQVGGGRSSDWLQQLETTELVLCRERDQHQTTVRDMEQLQRRLRESETALANAAKWLKESRAETAAAKQEVNELRAEMRNKGKSTRNRHENTERQQVRSWSLSQWDAHLALLLFSVVLAASLKFAPLLSVVVHLLSAVLGVGCFLAVASVSLGIFAAINRWDISSRLRDG